MRTDVHEQVRASMARCLARDAAPEEQRRLAEHLAGCAECRREMELSRRALRALGGFSFALDPALTPRVQAALARRARELENERADRKQRRRLRVGFVAAVLMTAAGSLAAWLAAGWFAGTHHVSPLPLHAGVLIFWTLPSLCAALPLLLSDLLGGAARGKELAS
ncbi:MAG TPA: hypothetical protein VHR45_02270 [Thermoanaerobaculia bacterium]|nr:hypothetical protein [Thermoanaerobaculia bacterium]